MLPDLDGFEVCRRLRAAGNDVPVIFLTARDTSSDTVTGLALGGDDYVTKPFSVEALVARVRAVLRRAARTAPATGRVARTPGCSASGTWSWTSHAGPCTGPGAPVELSPTEFRLLAYLMRHQGRVLTRAQLLENVWGWDYAGQSQIVETYVSYLRHKLDPLGPPLIHTQRGVGYSLRPAARAAPGARGRGGPAGRWPPGRQAGGMTGSGRLSLRARLLVAADRGDRGVPADHGRGQRARAEQAARQPVQRRADHRPRSARRGRSPATRATTWRSRSPGSRWPVQPLTGEHRGTRELAAAVQDLIASAYRPRLRRRPAVRGPRDSRAAAARGGPAGPGPGQRPGGRAVLVVARPVGAVNAQVGGIVVAELITGGALILLLAVSGRWLIGRGLAPLSQMASTAQQITTRGDLTARMPDADDSTEVGRLGAAINTMLDRIQQAFGARLRSEQKVRQFAADASHELRTPLTTIRGYAELYRQGALGPDQLPDAMRRIEQESQRMSTLVAELLELARLDRTSSLDLTETDLAGAGPGRGRGRLGRGTGPPGARPRRRTG